MATTAKIVKEKKPPKFKIRLHNRCRLCGRPRGFLRKFALCRLCFPAVGARRQYRRCDQEQLVTGPSRRRDAGGRTASELKRHD